MITDSFDPISKAIIDPYELRGKDLPKVDICIITFSCIIERSVRENYPCKQIAVLRNAAGAIEDCIMSLDCGKFLAFGGAGCLDKEIAHGKVMVPTEAYRDEGTSYHYAAPADYIRV